MGDVAAIPKYNFYMCEHDFKKEQHFRLIPNTTWIVTNNDAKLNSKSRLILSWKDTIKCKSESDCSLAILDPMRDFLSINRTLLYLHLLYYNRNHFRFKNSFDFTNRYNEQNVCGQNKKKRTSCLGKPRRFSSRVFFVKIS